MLAFIHISVYNRGIATELSIRDLHMLGVFVRFFEEMVTMAKKILLSITGVVGSLLLLILSDSISHLYSIDGGGRMPLACFFLFLGFMVVDALCGRRSLFVLCSIGLSLYVLGVFCLLGGWIFSDIAAYSYSAGIIIPVSIVSAWAASRFIESLRREGLGEYRYQKSQFTL